MTSRLDSLPSIGALRTFSVVAELGSFSKAAGVLHVTQSAVSHRVRGLEDALGVPLLDRGGGRVAPTRAGEILRRAAREAFERLEEGLVEVERSREDTTVAVSCSPSFAIRWLVPHLAALRESEPELDVRISADDRLATPGAGGVDLCVRFGPGGYEGYRVDRLTHEEIRAVCSPLYREQLGIEAAEDVLSATLLHADVLASHPRYLGWEAWLAAGGIIGEPDGALHFSHAHMALDAAVAGQGIALGRTTLTREALRTGRLVELEGPRLTSGFCYWLVRSRRALARDAVSRFAAWLEAAVAVP